MSKTAQRVVQRILADAAVAMGSNPFSAGARVLSDPPTVTGSATAPSSTTYSRVYDISTMDLDGVLPWNILGGEPVLDDWGVRLDVVTHYVDPLASPTVPVRGQQEGGIEFYLDGDEAIVILEAGFPYRFAVQEGTNMRYVDATGLGSAAVTGTGKAYYKLAFATREHRRILVDIFPKTNGGFDAGRFGGVMVKDTDQVFSPAKPGLRWFIVGDSNLQARNDACGDGVCQVAFKMLGAKDIWNCSVGGTGAVSPYGPIFSQRRTDWLDHAPVDVILHEVSGNDMYADPSTITTGLMAEVNASRTAFPEAVIFVQGYSESADDATPTFSAHWHAVNAAVKTAVADLDDNYCRFLDEGALYEAPETGQTPDEGNFGNYSIYIATAHWTGAGAKHQGFFQAQLMLQALEDMYYGAAADDTVVTPPADAFSPTSGSTSFTVGTSKSVNLATASSGIATGSVSSSPSLPAGLSASVGSGHLTLSGTATTATAADDYVLTANKTGGGTVSFTVHLTVAAATSGGSGDWTPAELSQTIAWYIADADDNTVASSLTTVLADQGAGGYNASAVRGGAVMTDTLNGRPVLKTTTGGDGVFFSDAAGDAIGTSADIVSIFAVHKLVDKNGSDYPGVVGVTNGHSPATNIQTALLRSETGHADGSVSIRTRPSSSDTGLEVGDSTDHGTDWMVLGATRRYANDDGTVWVNGTQVATGTMTATHSTDSGNHGLTIGHYTTAAATDLWSQELAEVLVVRGAITTDERQRIEGYLAWQWGLEASLPSGHPYLSAPPPTTLSSTPWTPAELAEDLVWYVGDNSANPTMFGNLTGLVDKGPLGIDVSGANAGIGGTGGTLNSRNVWGTDQGSGWGNEKATGVTFLGGASGVTMYAVQKMTTAHEGALMQTTFGDGSTSRAEIRRAATGELGVFGRRVSGDSLGGVWDSTNHGSAWLIAGATIDYATATGKVYADGALTPASGTIGSTGTAGSGTTDTVSMGGGHDGIFNMVSGWIAEGLMVKGVLSDSDRQKLEGYLAWTWGLEGNLPSGHPYASAAPTV